MWSLASWVWIISWTLKELGVLFPAHLQLREFWLLPLTDHGLEQLHLRPIHLSSNSCSCASHRKPHTFIACQTWAYFVGGDWGRVILTTTWVFTMRSYKSECVPHEPGRSQLKWLKFHCNAGFIHVENPGATTWSVNKSVTMDLPWIRKWSSWSARYFTCFGYCPLITYGTCCSGQLSVCNLCGKSDEYWLPLQARAKLIS